MKAKQQTRVLIAEDDPMVGEMTQGMLEDIGFVVAARATDGEQAVQLTQSLRPDVVLMDLQMPKKDGIQATQQIQETCPTPVVVLTAYETMKLVKLTSSAGVGAYLVKPPKATEMERAIMIAMDRFDDMMDLRRSNDALKAENQDLDTFAQTVAHDLQTPLSPIVGFASLIKDDQHLPTDLREPLNIITRNGRKMKDMINELLLLSSVRKANVELEPVDMQQVIAEVKQRLAPMIKEYEAKVIFPDSWPTAKGYGPWVEEIWANYISNAIKYGGHPARVLLGATHLPDGMIKFWVRDNGQGLTPQEQAQLFTPFTRLGQVNVKGHGLGLSIVERIVEKLAGQVGVESEVGHGSTFYFTLHQAYLM